MSNRGVEGQGNCRGITSSWAEGRPEPFERATKASKSDRVWRSHTSRRLLLERHVRH